MPKRKPDILRMTQEELRRFASEHLPSEIKQRLGRDLTQPEHKRIFEALAAVNPPIRLMPPARMAINEQGEATLTLLESGVSVSLSVQQQKPASQKQHTRLDDSALNVLLTVEQAAARLNLGRTILYAMVGRGEILSVKVGRRRLIPAHAVESYAKALEEGACLDVVTERARLYNSQMGAGKLA